MIVLPDDVAKILVVIGVAFIVLVIGVSGTYVLLRDRLRVLAVLRSPLRPSLLSSPSIAELRELARTTTMDRVEVIKEYYDWQHKVLLAVITGVVAFIGGNAVLVVEAAVGQKEAASEVGPLLSEPAVAAAFAAILIMLVVWTMWLLSKLGRLPQEYFASITIYQRYRMGLGLPP